MQPTQLQVQPGQERQHLCVHVGSSRTAVSLTGISVANSQAVLDGEV